MHASLQFGQKKWRTSIRAFAVARAGNIAVEFGFIAPVVLIMLLGVAEVSVAISNQLTVQAAARAGAHYGFMKPPVQGNMQPVIDSVKAAMPAKWVAIANSSKATIAASVTCECELTGAAVCGAPCAAGERSLTYLKIDVAKKYEPLVKIQHVTSNFVLRDTVMVRLQ